MELTFPVSPLAPVAGWVTPAAPFGPAATAAQNTASLQAAFAAAVGTGKGVRINTPGVLSLARRTAPPAGSAGWDCCVELPPGVPLSWCAGVTLRLADDQVRAGRNLTMFAGLGDGTGGYHLSGDGPLVLDGRPAQQTGYLATSPANGGYAQGGQSAGLTFWAGSGFPTLYIADLTVRGFFGTVVDIGWDGTWLHGTGTLLRVRAESSGEGIQAQGFQTLYYDDCSYHDPLNVTQADLLEPANSRRVIVEGCVTNSTTGGSSLDTYGSADVTVAGCQLKGASGIEMGFETVMTPPSGVGAATLRATVSDTIIDAITIGVDCPAGDLLLSDVMVRGAATPLRARSRYAPLAPASGSIRDGVVRGSNVTFQNCGRAEVLGGNELSVSNLTIEGGTGTGIYLGRDARYTSRVARLNLTGGRIACVGPAVEVDGLGSGTWEPNGEIVGVDASGAADWPYRGIGGGSFKSIRIAGGRPTRPAAVASAGSYYAGAESALVGSGEANLAGASREQRATLVYVSDSYSGDGPLGAAASNTDPGRLLLSGGGVQRIDTGTRIDMRWDGTDWREVARIAAPGQPGYTLRTLTWHTTITAGQTLLLPAFRLDRPCVVAGGQIYLGAVLAVWRAAGTLTAELVQTGADLGWSTPWRIDGTTTSDPQPVFGGGSNAASRERYVCRYVLADRGQRRLSAAAIGAEVELAVRLVASAGWATVGGATTSAVTVTVDLFE